MHRVDRRCSGCKRSSITALPEKPVRKYEAVAKSGTLFTTSVNRLCHILIAAILFFGLLPVQDMAQANVIIGHQITDSDTDEFTCGISIPVPEAGIQQPAWIDNSLADSSNNISAPADAPGYNGATVHPETVNTIDGSQDGYTNATTESPAASTGPTCYESEIPQANPAMNELGPDYQEGSSHEYNDVSTSPVEYRHVVHYIDREVVREVVVEKPVELRQFASLEELDAWLAEDDTNEYVYLFAGKDGVCRSSDKYDCDDYAFQLQKRAANSGFLISVTIIEELGRPHMLNLACIGNKIYYIEPQSDKVRFYCNRD